MIIAFYEDLLAFLRAAPILSGELFIPVKILKYNCILRPVPFTHKVWRFPPQGNRNDFYFGVVSYLEKRWNDFCKILYSASLQHFVQLYTIPGIFYHRNHALQRHKHFIWERNSLCGGPFVPSFCVIKQQEEFALKTWKSRGNTRSFTFRVPLLQGLEGNFLVERKIGNTALSTCHSMHWLYFRVSLFYRAFVTAALQRTPVSVKRQLIKYEERRPTRCNN